MVIKRKKGQSTTWISDAEGNPVVGLYSAKSKAKGVTRFYVKHDGKHKQMGTSRDTPAAIAAFRLWEARQDKPSVAIRKATGAPSDDFGKLVRQREIEVTIDEDGRIDLDELLPVETFWQAVREAYHKDPVAFRQQLQMSADKSATLDDILACYVEDREGKITPDELGQAKTRWLQFVDIVGVKQASDLTRPLWRKYRKAIEDLQRKDKRNNVWTRKRFSHIKTICEHSITELELSIADKEALSICSLLKQPPKPKPQPVTITKKEYAAILKNADVQDTAFFMLQLNGAYDNIDLRNLTWEMIDWDNHCIRFDRQKAQAKAGEMCKRICKLWGRTEEALEELQAHYAKNHIRHALVFVSIQGRMFAKHTPTRHFKLLRDKAKITRNILPKHLRKSALTAASNSDNPVVPDRQIDMLAGHSGGIKDAYVVPRNVSLACQAVEIFYFGKGKK